MKRGKDLRGWLRREKQARKSKSGALPWVEKMGLISPLFYIISTHGGGNIKRREKGGIKEIPEGAEKRYKKLGRSEHTTLLEGGIFARRRAHVV